MSLGLDCLYSINRSWLLPRVTKDDSVGRKYGRLFFRKIGHVACVCFALVELIFLAITNLFTLLRCKNLRDKLGQSRISIHRVFFTLVDDFRIYQKQVLFQGDNSTSDEKKKPQQRTPIFFNASVQNWDIESFSRAFKYTIYERYQLGCSGQVNAVNFVLYVFECTLQEYLDKPCKDIQLFSKIFSTNFEEMSKPIKQSISKSEFEQIMGSSVGGSRPPPSSVDIYDREIEDLINAYKTGSWKDNEEKEISLVESDSVDLNQCKNIAEEIFLLDEFSTAIMQL